jgi:hypothetical protein
VADLIETVQWEVTIYQLETTDPVKGGNDGISNRQAKQLANRTAYLKQQVELKAPVESPTFIGTPAAPTAAANTNTNQIATTAFALSQNTAVVGNARSLKCSITAASASATFTADELIVKTALSGLKYQISNLNKTINLATTGAGGMDTGSATASGFVAVYAILNPTTGATALLGVNTTSAVAPEVYNGNYMPSGYTASALISVWPTNSSSQFAVASQIGRKINFTRTSAISTASPASSITAISLSSIVPKNAKKIYGDTVSTASTAINFSTRICADAQSSGMLSMGGYVAASYNMTNNYAQDITTSQTLYYYISLSVGTLSAFSIYVSAYEF